jgi:cell division protein FtsB
VLVIILTALSAVFAYYIGRTRAEMQALQTRQIKNLREAFTLNAERKKLQTKKHLLLTQPDAITRAAREEYDYSIEGEKVLSPQRIETPSSPKITIKEKPFDFLLGNGGYPWRIPALTLAISLFFLGATDILCSSLSSKNKGKT